MTKKSTGKLGQEDPLEEQRRIHNLLSQETRHLIIQNILGHPQMLPSLDELDHMIPKNKASINDQLDTLRDAGIIQEYVYEPNKASRDLPSKFYGPTPEGIEILDEYNYLRSLSFTKTVYENTRKTEKVERHQDAPRPDLPDAVQKTLSSKFNESEEPDQDSEKLSQITRHISTENSNHRSLEDQVKVAKLLYKEEITSSEEGISVNDLKDLIEERNIDLEFRLRTSLDHLTEIGVIEKYQPPGPDIFVIGERQDEIINGRVEEYAEEEIESLIDHMDDEIEKIQTFNLDSEESGEQPVAVTDGAGRTIRDVLSEKFDIPTENIEEYLREGDQIKKLNEAVQAIKEHDDLTKKEDYGEILFLRQPYRYRLTEFVTSDIENFEKLGGEVEKY